MRMTDHRPLADRPPPDSPALRMLKRGWNRADKADRTAFLAMIMEATAKCGLAEYGYLDGPRCKKNEEVRTESLNSRSTF